MTVGSSSNLRTLAIVEANLTKGWGSATDFLLPLITAAAQSKIGQPFSIESAIEFVKSSFQIEIPVYLVETLVPKLEKSGALLKNKDINLFICQRVDLEADGIGLNESDFDELEFQISEFAKAMGFVKPMDSENWQAALIKFFADADSDALVGKFRNKLLSNPKSLDDRVISKFIFSSQKSHPALYDIIKRIYVAYSIADTISTISATGHKEEWNGLKVFYDTTVLMRLLGTSGRFLKNATLEMHTLLQDIGCRTFYFDHCLAEVFQNIEALSQRHFDGLNLHIETANALEKNEITIGEISLLKGSADKNLAKFNITQFEMPERISDTSGQINPIELEDYLTSNINYRKNTYAAKVDAESIEKILFLRKEKKFDIIHRAHSIFVTHNKKYSFTSAKYCREKLRYNPMHVPPIVTIGTLTRLAWLTSDNGKSAPDMSSQLLMNCFHASLPDANWLGHFWSTIQSSNPELLNIDAQESLYLADIRKLAEEQTIGNSALLQDLDIPALLERAKNTKEAEIASIEMSLTEQVQLREQEVLENKRLRELAIEELKAEKESEKEMLLEEANRNKTLHIEQEEFRRKKLLQRLNEERELALQQQRENELYRQKTKAQKHAKLFGKAVSLLLALIFVYLAYSTNSQFDFVNMKFDEIIKTLLFWFLAAMQIWALFYPKISLMNLISPLEKAIEDGLLNIYK